MRRHTQRERRARAGSYNPVVLQLEGNLDGNVKRYVGSCERLHSAGMNPIPNPQTLKWVLQLEGNESLVPKARVAVSTYTLHERKRDIANLMAIAFDQVSFLNRAFWGYSAKDRLY